MFNSTKSKRIKFDASDLVIKACYNQCHEKKLTFYNIFFEKVFVSEIKLQCSRQEIINHNNNVRKLKNVRKKNLKINNFYESQKFVALYHYQAIEQKTN